jgi:hypothetical protein
MSDKFKYIHSKLPVELFKDIKVYLYKKDLTYQEVIVHFIELLVNNNSNAQLIIDDILVKKMEKKIKNKLQVIDKKEKPVTSKQLKNNLYDAIQQKNNTNS